MGTRTSAVMNAVVAAAALAGANAVFEITGKRFRDLPLRHHDLTWS